MIEVFSDRDFTRVGLMKSLLDAANIPCFIQNQHITTMLTEIPVPVFFPKLCVLYESDEAEAKLLIREVMSSRATSSESDWATAEWQCHGCGVMVPAGFAICWNCELMKVEENGNSTPPHSSP